MSRTFILMGLLVLAAFALGLFVGWLIWTSPGADGSRSGRRPVRLRPMTSGLPDWEVEEETDRPSGVEWTAIGRDDLDPDPDSDPDPDPDGSGAGGSPAGGDEATGTTMLLGPRPHGDPEDRDPEPEQS